MSYKAVDLFHNLDGSKSQIFLGEKTTDFYAQPNIGLGAEFEKTKNV